MRRSVAAADRRPLHHDETKGNFSRPITQDTGRVRAAGRVMSQGRQIISSRAQLLAQDGRVLAHGTSTIIVLAGGR